MLPAAKTRTYSEAGVVGLGKWWARPGANPDAGCTRGHIHHHLQGTVANLLVPFGQYFQHAVFDALPRAALIFQVMLGLFWNWDSVHKSEWCAHCGQHRLF